MIRELRLEEYSMILKAGGECFTIAEAQACIEAIFSKRGRRRSAVIDLTEVPSWQLPALQMLANHARQDPSTPFQLAVVGSESLGKLISSSDLCRSIAFFGSMAEVSQPIVAGSPARDPGFQSSRSQILRFVAAVTEATAGILRDIAHLPIQSHRYTLMKDPAEVLEKSALVAGIPLDSAVFYGELLLIFPEKTYLGLMSAFLGRTLVQLGDCPADGATELLNMISGDVRNRLDASDDRSSALPRLLSRTDQLEERIQRASLLIEFRSEIGDFHMKFVEAGPR